MDVWYSSNISQPGFGTFYCFQYNNDSNNPVQTQSTGYSGSMSIVFSISTDITGFDERIGIQTTFSVQGSPPDLYNEIRFAPIGYDSFYALQQINTTYYNQTSTIVYQTSGSMVVLSKSYNSSNNVGYVAVSFAYQELSVTNIVYSPQYTLVNFLGDFAGMIGTLCGLDAVKVLAGVRLVPKCIRRRNFGLLQEHFNG